MKLTKRREEKKKHFTPTIKHARVNGQKTYTHDADTNTRARKQTMQNTHARVQTNHTHTHTQSKYAKDKLTVRDNLYCGQ